MEEASTMGASEGSSMFENHRVDKAEAFQLMMN
jgi:hypothetical protein